MTEIINISYTDFVQKCLKLDGDNWRFTNRPYIYPIINSNKKRIILMAGRQVEKSTTIAAKLLAHSCLNANSSSLYVTPVFKQAGVFSRKKIDEVFETSKLLRNNFYPGNRGFKVEEKRLKNFSTIYFRSAYLDADSIRGLAISGQISFDEFQDIIVSEIVQIIEACALKHQQAQFCYSGTPKTFDNVLEEYWQLSNQCEWHLKCTHCGHWNCLSIDNVLLDKPGVWCVKCQKLLNVSEGCWVNGKEADAHGFRLPGIILGKRINKDGELIESVDWKELFFKMRNWGVASLMNEVFGHSYDHGAKPLSREELIAACDSTRPMLPRIPPELIGRHFFAGIDWGGGNDKTTKKPSYTVLTIGYHCSITQKFKVVFCKRYYGKEAEPDLLIPSIAKTLMDFNAFIIGADWGFGIGLNSHLKRMLPQECIYVTFRHSIIKKFLAYDEAGETYVTNRTEVMTELFNRIKMNLIEFYKWSEFEDIGKDYLAINSEYSDTLRQIRYIHNQPDDAFHSCLYLLLAWMRGTQQIPITRYDPKTDDLDVNANNIIT